jgi:hypothetical protein
VLKDAGTREAFVTLEMGEEMIRIIVQDHGMGRDAPGGIHSPWYSVRRACIIAWNYWVEDSILLLNLVEGRVRQ